MKWQYDKKRGLVLPQRRGLLLPSRRGFLSSGIIASAASVDTSMHAKTGGFNTGTAAAGNTVAVSGVGFQPGLVLLSWSGATTTGNDASYNTALSMHQGFGVFTGPTSRRCYCNSAIDATSPTEIRGTGRSDACIAMMAAASDVSAGRMDVQSIDADGFTLVVDEQFAASLRIQFLAVARDGMSVVIGTFTSPAATGNFTVSSLGLAGGAVPNLLLMFGLGDNQQFNGLHASFGVFDGTNQWVFEMEQSDGTAAGTQSRSYLRAGEISAHITQANPPTAIDHRYAGVSFGADQFTLNRTEGAIALSHYYVAISGIDAKVGSSNSSVDNFVISSLGFKPAAEALVTHGAGTVLSTADTVQTEAFISMGFATSPTDRRVQCAWSRHNAGASVDARTLSRADAVMVTPSTVTSPFTAIINQIDVQSFDAAGITHVRDVDNNDNIAHAWFALGPAA